MTNQCTVRAVEAIPLAVTGAHEFRISEGGTRRHTSVLLRLLTDDPAIEGNAEVVCAPPGKPEHLPGEIVEVIRDVLTPVLLGLDAGQRNMANARVSAALKERAWIQAAVNVAFYDLHAKSRAISVSELLGGRLTDQIPVIGAVIGIMEPAAMADRAAQEVALGYDTLKVKVGDTVKTDVARVAAVRERVGDDVALRVDANDHYSPAEAIRLIRAIERFEIEHIEQPVARRDILGMVEVRKAIGIPLMTDDMVATPREAMNIVRLGGADRVKVKVTKHGLDGAKLIIGMMESAGIHCVLGHVFEMGLAAVAEAQLAACSTNLVWPCEIGSMRPMGSTADIIRESLEPQAGVISLPNGPGLGMTLDWDSIGAMRTD